MKYSPNVDSLFDAISHPQCKKHTRCRPANRCPRCTSCRPCRCHGHGLRPCRSSCFKTNTASRRIWPTFGRLPFFKILLPVLVRRLSPHRFGPRTGPRTHRRSVIHPPVLVLTSHLTPNAPLVANSRSQDPVAKITLAIRIAFAKCD
jgi:hypothetical protein